MSKGVKHSIPYTASLGLAKLPFNNKILLGCELATILSLSRKQYICIAASFPGVVKIEHICDHNVSKCKQSPKK